MRACAFERKGEREKESECVRERRRGREEERERECVRLGVKRVWCGNDQSAHYIARCASEEEPDF